MLNPVGIRIIPAYAGSTFDPTDRKTWCRDHPRIRGEHASLLVGEPFGAGSSPHTRGAPRQRHRRDMHQGIIPAYAGSTALDVQDRLTMADHPRIRGEHSTKRDFIM